MRAHQSDPACMTDPFDPLGLLLASLPGPLPLFLGALTVLLVGYAMLGKGFAYLGLPPIYIGDATLAVGVALVLASGQAGAPFRSAVTWLIVAFATWGAARTLPFVGRYGIEALRDAAVWGYMAYAIVCAACLIALPARLVTVVQWYARLAIPFVAWVPIFWGFFFIRDSLPRTPFSDVPFLWFKAGDAAVHMAGIAALWWAGLGTHDADAATTGQRFLRYGGWALWFVAFVFVSAESRSAALSITAALAMVAVLHPAAIRNLASMAVAAALAGVLAGGAAIAGAGVYFTPRFLDTSRGISVSQVGENLSSLFGSDYKAPGFLEDTRQFRLEWWSAIATYTFAGPHFWTGKGFGVNLADDDGFQVGATEPLRSPHSIHLNVLARTGVPGLALWIALHLSFLAAMVRGTINARRAGQVWWAKVNVWILGYWTAFLVNASFDVYLEGPQGAIWFWSLVGTGLASLHLQRQERFVRAVYRASREVAPAPHLMNTPVTSSPCAFHPDSDHHPFIHAK